MAVGRRQTAATRRRVFGDRGSVFGVGDSRRFAGFAVVFRPGGEDHDSRQNDCRQDDKNPEQVGVRIILPRNHFASLFALPGGLGVLAV